MTHRYPLGNNATFERLCTAIEETFLQDLPQEINAYFLAESIANSVAKNHPQLVDAILHWHIDNRP